MKLKKLLKEAEKKYPTLKLIQQYPGMEHKKGTIFKYDYDYPGYSVNDTYFSSTWKYEYFKPWIGKFFKIVS